MSEETTLANSDAFLPANVSDAAAIIGERLKIAFTVAINNPRKETECWERIQKNCRNPKIAETSEYSVRRGRDIVRGPSIRFAEMVLREWGNIFVDTQITRDDEFIRRCKVMITDLQSNAQYSHEITVEKTVERSFCPDGEKPLSVRKNSNGKLVYKLKATESDVAPKFAAEVSKALRTFGLRLIPTYVIEDGIEACRETVLSGVKEDPDSAQKKLIKAFSALRASISVSDLEQYLGHKIEHMTDDEILSLRAVYTSLKDGHAVWADYVVPKQKASKSTADKLNEEILNIKTVTVEEPSTEPTSTNDEECF